MSVQVSGDSTDRLSGVYTEYWEEKEIKLSTGCYIQHCLFYFQHTAHSTLTEVEISSTVQRKYLNL